MLDQISGQPGQESSATTAQRGQKADGGRYQARGDQLRDQRDGGREEWSQTESDQAKTTGRAPDPWQRPGQEQTKYHTTQAECDQTAHAQARDEIGQCQASKRQTAPVATDYPGGEKSWTRACQRQEAIAPVAQADLCANIEEQKEGCQPDTAQAQRGSQ